MNDNKKLDEQTLENDERAEIARLAALNPLQYHRARAVAADELGVTVGALDKAVAMQRPKRAAEGETQLPHWQLEPWSDPVDTAKLLNAIVDVLNRYVVLPKHASAAMALWCLHAWAFDAWDLSPFLLLTSPTKRCGKTTALILLNWLTPRSVVAGNISPTSIFRYIEEQQPTLLIDEADTFLKISDEIRGILNAGHTKATAHAIRNVEISGQHVPKLFSTWSPKIIAGIGRFAGTLEDRSVIVPMQRKSKGARVKRCRHRDTDELIELRQKALRWSTDVLPVLELCKPKLPTAINDRAADNWEPLLAIAEVAGEDWTKKARDAALALSGSDEDSDDIGVEFLRDVRKAFAANADADIFTRELIEHIIKDPERPWSTYAKGDKPVTDRHIARLLRPFQIISTTIHRAGGVQAKGYRLADFQEAWESYPTPQNIPPAPEVPSQAYECTSVDLMGTSDVFSSVQEPHPYGNEKCELPANHAGLYASTLKQAPLGAKGSNGHDDGLQAGSNGAHPEPCAQCNADDGQQLQFGNVWLHKECKRVWDRDHPEDLSIPPYLDRRSELQRGQS